jgi:hypothetical protein
MQAQAENPRPEDRQRLVLKRETLRRLTTSEMRLVVGGAKDGCTDADSGCNTRTR